MPLSERVLIHRIIQHHPVSNSCFSITEFTLCSFRLGQRPTLLQQSLLPGSLDTTTPSTTLLLHEWRCSLPRRAYFAPNAALLLCSGYLLSMLPVLAGVSPAGQICFDSALCGGDLFEEKSQLPYCCWVGYLQWRRGR